MKFRVIAADSPDAFQRLRNLIHRNPHGPLGAFVSAGMQGSEDVLTRVPFTLVDLVTWAILVLFPAHNPKDPDAIYKVCDGSAAWREATVAIRCLRLGPIFERGLCVADYLQAGRTALANRVWAMPPASTREVIQALDPVGREALVRACPLGEIDEACYSRDADTRFLALLRCAVTGGPPVRLDCTIAASLESVRALLPAEVRGALVLEVVVDPYGRGVDRCGVEGEHSTSSACMHAARLPVCPHAVEVADVV